MDGMSGLHLGDEDEFAGQRENSRAGRNRIAQHGGCLLTSVMVFSAALLGSHGILTLVCT